MVIRGIRISKRRILMDGAVLSGLFSILVILSLYVDATMWVDDYPPDIRAAFQDSTETHPGIQVAFGGAFMLLMIGGMLLSNRLLYHDLGESYYFSTAFVHTLALFWFINLFDVMVVDWLFFVTLQPDFIVLPGTAGMPGYKDYYFHFKASFLQWKPWAISVIVSVFIASISVLWQRQRPRKLVGMKY